MIVHITTDELAKRWQLTTRTLQIWRLHGDGTPFLKIGSRVMYRMADVEAYEKTRLRLSTSQSIGEQNDEY